LQNIIIGYHGYRPKKVFIDPALPKMQSNLVGRVSSLAQLTI